jgi:uncharacterized protein
MPRYDYPRMIHEALRQVIRSALAETAEEGLSGEHHFYVTFDSAHPGVDMPQVLRDLYPERMTIVLQHQFWDLEAGPEDFAVTLAFDSARHRLTIPYTAVEAFADPAAEFGLRFDTGGEEEGGEEPAPEGGDAPAAEGTPAVPRATSAVVRLDDFRKKDR